MPLDGITAKALSIELNKNLKDARVDRIYQPERFDLVFYLRLPGEQHKLILSANPANPRLHLTNNNRKNPSEPPMFCMLMRKHLLGAKLLSVETPDYERIFIFRFQTINELGDTLEKRVIVEIMGRHSNIILVNHDDRIHDSILHVDSEMSRLREIMPARPYQMPPSQNKQTPATIISKINSGQIWFLPQSMPKALEKAILESCQGFSPQLCQEIAELAGIDARSRVINLDKSDLQKIDQAMLIVLNKITQNLFNPSLYYISQSGSLPVDFHALELKSLAYRRSATSVSEAMDSFYYNREIQNTLKQKRQHLQKLISGHLDHTRKKYQIHLDDQKEGSKRDLYKQFGDLILSHINDVEISLAQGRDKVSLLNYYDPEQKIIDIDLQTNRTAAWNAQNYFRKYNKAKTKYETGSKLARQDEQDLIWLESLAGALENAHDIDDLSAIKQEMALYGLISESKESRMMIKQANADDNEYLRQANINRLNPGKPAKAGKSAVTGKNHANNLAKGNKKGKNSGKKTGKGSNKTEALPPRKFISKDKMEILVGRNNLQNDQLTLKSAQKDDIWLHVQKMPGTHVIIRTNHLKVPDSTLQEAAGIAAWYSKAGIVGGAKIPVDYCPVSNVRKPNGARPGMVIYDHYQTIMIEPLNPEELYKNNET